MSFDISIGPMKLKMRCHSGDGLNYHGPVPIQPNDVSLVSETTNAHKANRTTGSIERVIDVKCINLHAQLCFLSLFGL